MVIKRTIILTFSCYFFYPECIYLRILENVDQEAYFAIHLLYHMTEMAEILHTLNALRSPEHNTLT